MREERPDAETFLRPLKTVCVTLSLRVNSRTSGLEAKNSDTIERSFWLR